MALHDVQALKQQVPLVDLLAQHGVELKRNGRELVALCPFHSEDTPSFTVEPDKGEGGLYYCMGCGAGGSQVDFLVAYHNIDSGEAIKRLAALAGGAPVANDNTRPRKKVPTRSKEPDVWQAAPAPENEPAPATLRVQRQGNWIEYPVVAAWPYLDAGGQLHAYDCRIEFDKPDGTRGKDIIPVRWMVNTQTGECRWRQGSLPKPRLLYGTELLAAHPGMQVMIAEGCKTADAARRLLAGTPVVVVSWMGGSKAVKFADWSALAGRKVVIWPDCDSQRDKQTGEFKPYTEQAGVAAALEIVEQLQPHGAQVRIVAVPPPGEWADGYDLADAEAEGRDAAWVLQYLREHLRTADEIKTFHVEQPPAPEAPPADEAPPIEDGPPPAGDDYPPAPAEPPPAMDDQQPFRLLGWDRLTAYYLPDGSEQIIDLTAAAHTKNNLIALAPLSYWERQFPSSKKGSDGVDWTMAINALIQRSQRKGIYDPELVRGRGAWWEDGRWAVHLGDRVIIDGKSYPLRDAPTRYVYEKSTSMEIQFENPLSASEGVKLVQLCERLRWVKPISGKLLAGWIFLAPICGAIDWRPHIWLTGGSGSGKSTVMRHFIGRCLKGICLQVEGDTSEAGIRQALVYDARPVVFDEFESERKKAAERVEDVLAMVTRASSESDAKLLKGSGDGKATGYRTRAMFAFSSIAVNLKQFAASTRVTVLDLYSEPESEQSLAAYNSMMDDLFATLTPEYIQRLQARAVHMIPTIRQNAQTFAEAAAIALKSRRMGDQIGTLLAGVYALHSSKPISREDAVAWINRQNWDDVAEVTEGRDEVRCLAHILSCQIRVETSTGNFTRTIGELIQRATGYGGSESMDYSFSAENASATLARHGIRIDGGHDRATVSFANSHRELQRILAGTPWEGSYSRTLLRIEGSSKRDTAAYAAARKRGVQLPVGAVL